MKAEPPATNDIMKPKTPADKTKTSNAGWLRRLVRRKGLIHGIADCLECDWKCGDYLTVQKSAALHHRKTGHRVSMELGYHVEFTPNVES